MTPNLYHPVSVGPAILPGPIFLAPVAGYSDAAYRSVCISEGADLCYTEMVSAEALVRGHRKTKSLLERSDNEKAYAIQLFGSKPEVLARAAEIALAWNPVLIDLNCGCPVPKIIKSGAGAALLRDPASLEVICRSMAEILVPAGVPLTVKIRLGWDESSINYLDTARAAVTGGAAAVTLHARTKSQGYSGKADWPAIKALVEASGVPVFGSGDIWSGEAARRLLVETGAAGVMIARGAMGNPFLFGEVRAALEGRDIEPPARSRRVAVARLHLGLSARFLGERSACVEFRKHFCAYTKGCALGAALRAEAVRASSLQEFEGLFARWEGSSTPHNGS